MKKRISKYIVLGVLSVAIFCPSHLLGQGILFFSNAGFSTATAVYDVDGTTPLMGSAFLAELYASPVGGSLSPVDSSITPFSTTLPGYFIDQDPVVVPGVVPGAKAVVQVVAWRASDGATFAAADHPGGHAGRSAIFITDGLGDANVPLPGPLLTGLQSFSLQVVVPEPSVLCLGVAELGGLMLLRRWRR